jgi:potassium channel LctB
MVMSLRALFYPSRWKERLVSIRHFLFLGMCFVTIMLGFGLLYMLLELEGIHILMENGEYVSGDFFDYIFTTMYFSGITLFSVGYGDVTPIGIGRGVALIESWLGFTIPAAFVVKSFLNYEKK